MLTMALYLIEILHQTTTWDLAKALKEVLYLIEILHQTTTGLLVRVEEAHVVSYRNSTSNHNLRRRTWTTTLLYLIEILHQTTTAAKF